MEQSQVQEYYAEKCVFITGGTGFLGKLLLEKLLRSTTVEKVYLLIRKKEKKNADERLQELFKCPIFDGIKRTNSSALEKIVVVEGDMQQMNLGIDEKILREMVRDVQCVFHTAAAAKINQTIVEAIRTNVKGVQELLDIGRSMKKLKSLVLVSTAYSNCTKEEIDEKFYDVGVDVEELVNSVDAHGLNGLEKYKQVTENWPSSFTFSMALAENLIKNECGKLPVALVRVSSIISTNHEPIRGYIDSCHGPTGVLIGVGLGMMRVFYGDDNVVGDVVTADYAINNVIAAGWAVNEYRDYDRLEKVYQKEKVPIFNCVSSPKNPIKWSKLGEIMHKYNLDSPSNKIMWYPYKIMTKCVYAYLLLKLMLHYFPALLTDLVLKMMGKNAGLVQFYAKMENYSGNIEYFMNKSWTFNDSNNQELLKGMTRKDRELFNFDLSDIDWESYFEFYTKGIRVYILKDDMSSVEKAKNKLKVLKYIHYFLTGVAVFVFYFTLRFFLKMFLRFFIDI